MSPLCSVSIDVDPIPCYYRIHGLGTPPPTLRDTVMRQCVPRFADLLAQRGIAATFFVVAEDVDPDAVDSARATRALLEALCADGHELASHSYSHPYDMARLSAADADDEIARAHDLLSDVAGQPIVGFRAPGYDLSASMVDALIARGYAYDSSMFPAPGYYAAKAAVMAALAIAGKPSGAVLTNPRALAAPCDPYRPSARAPWRRGDAPLVELPIAVTPGLRLPVIGTNLLLAPAVIRRQLLASIRRRPFFNFELHGIDLADADRDGIPGELATRQRDLRLSAEQKVAALQEVFDDIQTHYDVVTLTEAAEVFAG